MEILPVDFDDAKTLLNLKLIHNDPFDSMIISQSITSKLKIITKDIHFSKYDVEILW